MRLLYKCPILLLSAGLLLGILSCGSTPSGLTAPPVIEEEQLTDSTITLLLSISELLDQEDFDSALDLFEAIEEENAENMEIRLLRAAVLISAGRTREARLITGEILNSYPDYIPALLVLAAVEESQGRNREQRAALERVLRLEPNNVQALVSMGNFLIRNNNTRQAGAFFDRALAVDPGDGDALLGRAWVYRNNRDSQNARVLLDRAVELYPDWSRPIHERGRLLKATGSHRAALEDLNRANALDPGNYFIIFDRADAFRLLGQREEALTDLERAIAIDPANFAAYVYSASLRDELGDHDGAMADYQTLTRLNPDYYFAFEGLGIHLMRRGEWLAAKDAFVEAYNRAVRMNHSREDEGSFALLASVNWLRGARVQDVRPFMDQVLRRLDRNSVDHRLLRLFRDQAGDLDVSNRIDRERDPAIKSRMLFYLAQYYDIRGNTNLANRFFLQVKDINITTSNEWRINEWILEERGLALR